MPKKVDHDARREELVLAAWRVIAANGIDEVTIRDIARESGFSSGVLAHYFKNKDDLLARALRLSHTRIRKRYDAEVEAPVAADALKAILIDNLPMDEQRDLLGAMIDGISLHALLYPDRLPPKKQAAVMEFALQLLK